MILVLGPFDPPAESVVPPGTGGLGAESGVELGDELGAVPLGAGWVLGFAVEPESSAGLAVGELLPLPKK